MDGNLAMYNHVAYAPEHFFEPEEWADILGYEGFYKVSTHGRVKSLSKIVKSRNRASGVNTRTIAEGIRKSEPTNNGYLRITLSKDGVNKRISIHRLVAKTFIGNPQEKKAVNHKNGIKTDNRVENLEWVTHSENEIHSYRVLGKVSPRKLK
jgi:hypothetical protein